MCECFFCTCLSIEKRKAGKTYYILYKLSVDVLYRWMDWLIDLLIDVWIDRRINLRRDRLKDRLMDRLTHVHWTWSRRWSPFLLRFSHSPILVQINLQHSQVQPYGKCTSIIYLTMAKWINELKNILIERDGDMNE